MIPFDLFNCLVVGALVLLFLNQVRISRRTTLAVNGVRGVRKGLIQMGRPSFRPTFRNRELMDIGRRLDGVVARNGDKALNEFLRENTDRVERILDRR